LQKVHDDMLEITASISNVSLMLYRLAREARAVIVLPQFVSGVLWSAP
jgi:hypothetical protein